MTTTETRPTEAEDAPPPDPNDVPITLNGVPIVARKGELIISAAERRRRVHPALLLPRADELGRHVPDVHRRGRHRSRSAAARRRAWSPVSPDMKVDTRVADRQERAGGRPRAAARQPPARLPGLRQGRRVPAAGPDVHARSRARAGYVEEKRHYEKPIPISDLVLLDRERCILCDRCTRFADEVAGDALIHFTQRGNLTQITRSPTSRSPATSAATPCRSARSARSPRSRTGSRRVRGTSTRSRAPAPRARSAAARWCSRSRDELVCATWASTASRSTGAGCATAAASTSRPSTARIASPRRSCATARRACVETNWGTAVSLAAQVIRGRDRERRRRAASRCSAARAAPTRTRSRGRGSRTTSSARRTCRAQLGDGLPVGVLGLPRATIDEAANAATIILLGPDLKEELPVLYLRLRDAVGEAAHESSSSRRSRAADAVRVALDRLRARHQVAAVQQTLADADVADAARVRAAWSSSPAAPTSPRRSAATVAGAAGAARRGARARRCCRRCAAATSSARCRSACGRARRARHARRACRLPPTARSSCWSCVGAIRSADFPDTDLARRALAGARRIIAVDTFLTGELAAGRRRPAAATYRREERAPPPTSRAASPASRRR